MKRIFSIVLFALLAVTVGAKRVIVVEKGSAASLLEAVAKANALNSSTAFQRFIGSNFGDRAALSAVNALTHRIGYLTLGMGNVSSALLNLSQLINAYGYLGEGTNLIKYVAKYSKPNSKFDSHDLRILTRCGTLEDMGLDANSGYDKNRGLVSHLPILNQIDKVGNFSMKPFQKADAIARIATTLAAYDKARYSAHSFFADSRGRFVHCAGWPAARRVRSRAWFGRVRR